MDQLIEKLITNGGPLGVLVIIVYVFLKDRKEQTTEHRAWMSQTIRDNQEHINSLSKEHLNERVLTRVCIDQNTSALREVTKTIGICTANERKP
jgi:hypothetical protein